MPAEGKRTMSRRIWLAGLVLAALVAIAYRPVIDHGFVDYDDNLTVTNNPVVLAGISARGVAWAFTTFHSYNWQPLTWLSHMLDIALFGLAPRGHHLVNLLFHMANTLLLLTLLTRLTGAFGRSLLVALFFALHPLHAESVAWISERKDLLSTFFWLLGLHAYARYVAAPNLNRGALVLLALAAGLMAKPMPVTAPLVMLLLDFWPLGRWGGTVTERGAGRRRGLSLLTEKAPLFALSAASAAVTVAAQSAGGAVRTLQQYPFAVRLVNALNSYVAYLGHTLWPSGLHSIYPYQKLSLARGALAGAALVLATGIAFRERRRRPWLAAGWAWYLVTLLPVIGLVQVGAQAMADRYTYITLTGIFVIAAWGSAELATRLRLATGTVVLLTLSLIAALTAATHVQAGYWKDNLTLFGRSVRVDPRSHIAQNNYGGALLEKGRTAEAIDHFRQAIAGNPAYADPYLNLGQALWRLEQKPQALAAFEKAVALKPDDRRGLLKLGMALVSLGDLPKARDVALRLGRVDPDGSRRLHQAIEACR